MVSCDANVFRRKIWFLTIFEWVGQGDQRYFHANSFIVSMGAILACVVGPSCFLFAWSMYSRKSYTNLLGITLCTVSSYSQVEIIYRFMHLKTISHRPSQIEARTMHVEFYEGLAVPLL